MTAIWRRRTFPASVILGLAIVNAAMSAAAAAEHPNLSGFWEPRAGSVHRNGPPAYTPRAQQELKKPSKMTNTNGVDAADTNCLPTSQPWNLYQSAPIDIAQDERETTMLYEGRTLPWHIYTDGRSPTDMAKNKAATNGLSFGRWEDDEFVVDSAGFAIREGHGALMVLPNSDVTHVIERFKLSSDGQELHAHFRIEDTQWLMQPYEFDVVWYRDTPDEYAQPQVCDARDSNNSHY